MNNDKKNFLMILNKKRNQEIENIKKYNEYTNKYGITLTDDQIRNIVIKKEKVLQDIRKS